MARYRAMSLALIELAYLPAPSKSTSSPVAIPKVPCTLCQLYRDKQNFFMSCEYNREKQVLDTENQV